MLNTFTEHLNLSQTDLEKMLSLRLQELLKTPDFKEKLDSLNIGLLQKTLPTAAAVLANELPPFYNWLKNELGLKRVPDSPDHTTKWVVNFLKQEESLTRLVELHRPVPRPALEASIPRLVGLFDGVEDAQVRQEWQQAIAALCLVLVVAAREEAQSRLVAV
ncbi:hypothetical protein NDI37_01545 [Funiculus sociatus GB2-A5]|uniref:Uncharacterized protein n=1 Tax=Funiculus sociatus GB2-A5 TaxID=2933946 RepID=A0ABV0JKA9_9CYAN|nr:MULTISPECIES: hypothetical protein [Cyanophyceae]MBD1922548.1 hypothetical protein [Microcoleus sp. FACHB-831]MBD2065673.1 hypothetical protein [Trichocoleus sp. FACHB-6]